MKLKHEKILIFDFETTGLSAIKDHVIEIGAILLEKQEDTYVEVKSLNCLIKQEEPVSEFITRLTGITNEMIEKEGIEEELAFNELSALIDSNTLLIAYNLAFDIEFLLRLFQKYVKRNYIIENDILDCMAVYKDRYPYPHKLESAVATFNIKNENAHRAIDDTRATYQVLHQLSVENDNLEKYVNVLGYNAKYSAPNTFFYKSRIKVVAQSMKGLKEIELSK